MPAPDPDSESTSTPVPSVKDLASSDPSLRRKNLTTILTHFSRRPPSTPLSTTQALQLWRAFSVALYMHDSKNMLSVQKLISNLASTLNVMYSKDIEVATEAETKESNSMTTEESDWLWLATWHVAFWTTLSREWSGIDQWRMNKYLLLIRFFIRELFQLFYQQQQQQNEQLRKSLLQTQIDILSKWPLSPQERKVPDGLRLHVLDVWMEEIERAREAAEAEAEAEDDSERKGGTKKRKRRSNDQGERPSKKAQEEVEITTKSSSETVTDKLMQPVRTLAREALGKGVRMKARELVKEYDAKSEK